MTSLLWIWICEIEVTMWFLMLVSDTMRVYIRSEENLRAILSRRWIWVLKLLLLCLVDKWKENQLEKISISQDSRVNFLLNRSKERKTLLDLLSILTIGLLIFECWLGIRVSNDNQ